MPLSDRQQPTSNKRPEVTYRRMFEYLQKQEAPRALPDMARDMGISELQAERSVNLLRRHNLVERTNDAFRGAKGQRGIYKLVEGAVLPDELVIKEKHDPSKPKKEKPWLCPTHQIELIRCDRTKEGEHIGRCPNTSCSHRATAPKGSRFELHLMGHAS